MCKEQRAEMDRLKEVNPPYLHTHTQTHTPLASKRVGAYAYTYKEVRPGLCVCVHTEANVHHT